MSVRTSPRRRAARRAPQARWEPPAIFDYFERLSDGKTFQVRQVYRVDRQVRLEACIGGERAFPFARQLAEEYRPVTGRTQL